MTCERYIVSVDDCERFSRTPSQVWGLLRTRLCEAYATKYGAEQPVSVQWSPAGARGDHEQLFTATCEFVGL